MSWGDDVAEFESWLSKTGGGSDPAERKKRAQALYAIWREAVESAIKNAPQTLFVTAAGNADANAGFLGDVPASLHLPNRIAVGAVNQAGDETSFTSYGDTVLVDADGYQVESYVPGGARLKLSGTFAGLAERGEPRGPAIRARSVADSRRSHRLDQTRSSHERRWPPSPDRRKALGRPARGARPGAIGRRFLFSSAMGTRGLLPRPGACG